MRLFQWGRMVLLLSVASTATAHGAHAAVPGGSADGESPFIGWLGESFNATASTGFIPAGVQVLSWEPRVLLYPDFLTEAECAHIVSRALPRLAPSVVTDPATAAPKLSTERTSSGMFFNPGEDAVIAAVEGRIAAWSMLPAYNGEGLQVLHYEEGQKYDAHHDWFYHPSEILNGGNRVATVIMYLTDAESGGETVFPHVPKAPHQTAAAGWTQCGQTGLGVRPKRGSALLFWNLRPDGVFDPLTLHGSCPVVKGEKVVATRWIHETRYDITPLTEADKDHGQLLSQLQRRRAGVAGGTAAAAAAAAAAADAAAAAAVHPDAVLAASRVLPSSVTVRRIT